MKLFTKEIDKKLFKQFQYGSDLSKQFVVLKIFNPYGDGRWFILNSDEKDPDYIWAIVQMHGEVEMGSVSRKELETLKVGRWKLPLERDLGFSPVNAAQLMSGLREGKFYKNGGWVEYANGGVVKWQDAQIGDNARVVAENKTGLIMQAYGRKFHLKFVDGSEKTYDAKELEFFTDEEFANGGILTPEQEIGQIEKAIIDTYGAEKEDGIISSDIEQVISNEKYKTLTFNGLFIQTNQGNQLEEIITALEKRGWKIYRRYAKGGEVDDFSVGDMVIIKNAGVGESNYVQGFNGKGKVVVAKPNSYGLLKVKLYKEKGWSDFNDYGYYKPIELKLEEKAYAKGGIVVTSIKDIPNFKERLEEGKITYRGLGMGKLYNDFYEIAGTSGTRIKVDGKEYYITDEEFDSFSRGADGKMRVRFDAPARRGYADGGEVDKHKIYFSSFAEVMDAINDIAEENGYKVVDIFPDLSYGGVSYGQTKRAKVELEFDGTEKKGKSKKREKNTLNVQIYRMDSGNYELNTYFAYADGGMMAKGGMTALQKLKAKKSKYADGGIIDGLTADEAIFLYIKRGLKSPFREKYLRPSGMWNTDKAKEVEKSLVKKGYLNSAGSINEIGKNKAKEIDVQLNYVISRGFLTAMDRDKKYKEVLEKFNEFKN